ncbi:MAG: MarR family transcriptional regulator [Rubrobacteraceae bacterium]
MDEERANYAEDFGLMFEGFGLPRMVGRVLGVLLISDPPELSAEELAEALQASRGSISSSTRTLIQMGLVQRRTRPGERKDYFRMKPGAWDELMRRELETLSRFRQMAERGLDIANSDSPEAQRNLEEMREFYAYWERELPAVLERWEEDKKKESTWAR